MTIVEKILNVFGLTLKWKHEPYTYHTTASGTEMVIDHTDTL